MLQPDKAEVSVDGDDRLTLIADQNRYLRTIRGMTFGLLLIASVSAIYFARDFLLPVVLAFLLALTLSPIVRYLQRRGISPAVTSVVLVAGVLGVIAAATFFLAGPVSNWLERAPAIGHQISMKVEALRSPVDAVVEASKQVDHLTETTSSPNVQKVVIEQPGLLSRAADNVVGTLTTISITVVLLLFLLSSGTLFYEKMISILPTLSDKKRALRIAYDVEPEISRYLLTVTVINVGLGVAVGAAMAATGMPNPMLWGVATALLNFVPYVGALTNLATIAVVALLSFDSVQQAMIPPILFVACIIIEGQFVTPAILGRRLELNSVAIFITLALWSWLWGIVGAILAVPMLVSVKVLCDHFEGLSSFGEFLSAGSPRSEPAEAAPETSQV